MALDFSGGKNAKRMQQMQQKMMMESNAITSANLPMELIVENKDNELIYGMDKLDKLTEVINEDGFTDPIGVYKMDDGTYEIFSGHKRFRAMKMRGEKEIPSLVFKKPKDNIERAKRLIRSNSLNRDDSPLIKARELQYYYDNVIVPEGKPGKKRKQLAEEFGISEGQCAKLMALLKLIPELQNLANNPDYAFSAFSPAAQLDEAQQKQLYDLIRAKTDLNGSTTIIRSEIEKMINEIKGVSNPVQSVEVAPHVPAKENVSEEKSDGVIDEFADATMTEENDNATVLSQNVEEENCINRVEDSPEIEKNINGVEEQHIPEAYPVENSDFDKQIQIYSTLEKRLNEFTMVLQEIVQKDYSIQDREKIKEQLGKIKSVIASIEEKLE